MIGAGDGTELGANRNKEFTPSNNERGFLEQDTQTVHFMCEKCDALRYKW